MRPLFLGMLMLLGSTASYAQTTVYFDELDFLANTGPVQVDSYEDLGDLIFTNGGPGSIGPFLQRSSYSITDGSDLRVVNSFEQTWVGDGDVYLLSDAPGNSLMFSFAEPQTIFGFRYADIGNQGPNTLSVTTNSGFSGIVLQTSGLPGNTGFFYGFITSENTPFTEVTFTDTNSGDGYFFDKVHFGVVLVDEDSDGFSPPADCDDADPLINPDAVELPGNFTDENCDGNLGDCDACFDWRNHGEYVRCIAHAAEDLVFGGFITEDEGDALVSSSAQSAIGKKGFVPPLCQ